MKQRSIVIYLPLKGLSARHLLDSLEATLRPDAVAYISATRYLREAWLSPSGADQASFDVSRRANDSNQAILSALEDNRFPSVR
jgi:hypothetical protein